MRAILRLSACLLVASLVIPARAEEPEHPSSTKEAGAAALRPLVPNSISKQSLDLPGRTLHFTADAGFVRILGDKGSPEADIATTAYVLDGADPASRPVTFVLNGGPGMASAWLQMGAVGPWRISMELGPSAAAHPEPNADTWLDFTDLVFIDPVGTGYSDFVAPGEDVRKRLWSLDGDIESIAQTIHRWLNKSGRMTSPKFLLGESYGAFRAPLLARRLAEHDGVGLRGLVLLSPVLDFGNHSRAFDLFGYANVLPSMAATVRAAGGKLMGRTDLQDAETYASGPFLSDVLRGVADPEAVSRVVEHVAGLTGLDTAFVREHRGLISGEVFAREHDRARRRVDSLYDATVSVPDPFPESPDEHKADPMLDGLRAPLTEAVLAVYEMLHWHPEGPIYRLLGEAANHEWDYGHDRTPEALDPLRQALALDPGLRVIVAHGLFDLVTPYYATQLLLNQIPPASGGDQTRLLTFPGGHMFYSHDESRRELRAAAIDLIGNTKP